MQNAHLTKTAIGTLVPPSDPAVHEAALRAQVDADHNCDENAVPYESDGPLGHGWECGVCGAFLQAG